MGSMVDGTNGADELLAAALRASYLCPSLPEAPSTPAPSTGRARGPGPAIAPESSRRRRADPRGRGPHRAPAHPGLPSRVRVLRIEPAQARWSPRAPPGRLGANFSGPGDR